MLNKNIIKQTQDLMRILYEKYHNDENYTVYKYSYVVQECDLFELEKFCGNNCIKFTPIFYNHHILLTNSFETYTLIKLRYGQ